MLSLLFLILLVVLVIGYILVDKKGTSSKDDAPKPPGPRGWPLVGYLPNLGRHPHKKLTSLRSKYGDVYRLQFGSREAVVLNGLETIRQAVVKQAEDFAGRPDFYSFRFIANGNSMGFGDYGPRWKLHRRIAQTSLVAFINKRNNPIEETIQEEAKVLVSHLLADEQQPVDPHNEIYLSVGNIICALCFGRRYRRDDPDFLQLVKMNDEFMAFAGAGNPVDIMPWTRFLTQRSFNQFLGILKNMDEFCLKKRKEHLDTYDAVDPRDVTDLLIKATQETTAAEKAAAGLTDEQILTTVQEMIGAGFDTISSTLQWAVLYMAMHEDIQERAKNEIHHVIGDERLPDMTDMEEMPLVEACILETMRMSCIFPFALPHSTTRDTQLNGYFIPDKTLVFLNLWSVTRDETKFDEPNTFNPDRFLDNKGWVRKDAADNLLPYGAGKRRCPGEQLARMELFIFFVILLQKCCFSRIPGVQYSMDSKYGLTLKPKDFKVLIRPR